MSFVLRLASFLGTIVIACSWGLMARADTLQVRCDIYAKDGSVTYSGLCYFSQRQGVVGIQLPDGRRFDLLPDRDRANTYTDLEGRPATRQLREGQGHVYRLAQQSIFVFWDTTPY